MNGAFVGFLPTGKKGERMDDTTAVLVTIDEDTARLIRQMAYVALRTRGWLSALVDLNRDPE